MKIATLANAEFNENNPSVQVLFETDNTKEIRIAMRAGQIMKEHKTPFPIVVEMFDGTLDFGVKGEVHHLKKGDVLALDGNVPHDLNAVSDSVIRLSLSKLDKVERVKEVAG